MSTAAIAWVWDQSSAKLADRLVMLAIADRTDKDTALCWPSVATVASDTKLSEREVQRAIRAMLDAGELEVVSGTTADAPDAYLRIPVNYRPRLLRMIGYLRSRRGDNLAPLRGDGASPLGVTNTTSRGDKSCIPGVTKSHPNQILNQKRTADVAEPAQIAAARMRARGDAQTAAERETVRQGRRVAPETVRQLKEAIR